MKGFPLCDIAVIELKDKWLADRFRDSSFTWQDIETSMTKKHRDSYMSYSNNEQTDGYMIAPKKH